MKAKKSEVSHEMIFAIIRVIFLTAVLFSVVLLVKSFFVQSISTKDIEATIFFNRILYGQGGILWEDKETGRVYTGIIDLKAFEGASRYLDQYLASYGDSPLLASKLTLKRKGQQDIIAYYHQEQFNRWEPRALPSVEGGSGSITSYENEAYVLIFDGEKFSPGSLYVNTLI
jgi:hypothetical protein